MTQVFSPPTNRSETHQEAMQYRSVPCEWFERSGIPGLPDTIKYFKSAADIPPGVFYYWEAPVRLNAPEVNRDALATNLQAIHKAIDWILRASEKSKRPPQGYTINKLGFTYQPGTTVYSIIFWRTGMFPFLGLAHEK